MRPSFHARLINDPFSDPGLFVPFLFQKRALLFDLGDLHPVPPKELLKISHVFVTHTHMDHFIGFDSLLRLFLGRQKTLHLFGPPGFFHAVEGKLAGYTWNLVHEYSDELHLWVNEIHSDRILARSYACKDRFASKKAPLSRPFERRILDEPAFFVEAMLLDHRIPCLGFSLTEHFYVNIIKEALRDLGLPVGPWLNLFKTAIYERQDPKNEFVVTWKESGGVTRQRRFLLGELTEKIARISAGQKITYVTDVVGTGENFTKIIELAKGADHLFIEAAFADEEKDVARRKYHLTAREAGRLAREAGVKHFHLFHYSPRYKGCGEQLEVEAQEAYRKEGHQP